MELPQLKSQSCFVGGAKNSHHPTNVEVSPVVSCRRSYSHVDQASAGSEWRAFLVVIVCCFLLAHGSRRIPGGVHNGIASTRRGGNDPGRRVCRAARSNTTCGCTSV
jgi:hypothetical protein